METPTYIIHIDMDAFFAAIEQRDNPDIQGKPVIIGSDPKDGKGRGVVATCSYEARKFGIHSAMPISIAYRKCPDGIYLRGDMKKYAQVSREIFELLETFTPDIEPISVDEAFMDITGSYHHFGTPIETCKKIKLAIKQQLGLSSSIGMAPNMMTAKIASDIDKPNGLTVVTEKNLLSFLHKLPVEKLWGVGAKTTAAFKNIGVYTIGDLAKQDLQGFTDKFGAHGEHAWHLANGIDPRHVEASDEIKSISNEYTFEKDTSSSHDIKNTLMFLSEKVSRRLRNENLKGRTITLRIRFSDFKTYTRSITLPLPTNYVDDLYKHCLEKTKEFNISRRPVRLLGVRVSNLIDPNWDKDLFADGTQDILKKERLHKALDKIMDKFGETAIARRG